MWNIHRLAHYWKHNRSLINLSDESSDDAMPGHSHRRNPTRTLLPSPSSANTCILSLRAGPWTLSSQRGPLHVSRSALNRSPAGSPLRVVDQTGSQRGTSQLAEVREIRPVPLRTLPDANFFRQDSVSVRRGSNLQDSLPSPSTS